MLEQSFDNAEKSSGSINNLDKQLYSVFLFDKSQLDKLPARIERDATLDHLKKSVSQFTCLRHPAILTVHHPLEESRSSLAFVSEHVFGHLGHILQEQRSKKVAQGGGRSTKTLVDVSVDSGPDDSDYQWNSCQLDDIQIKAGLLQVCDGLTFLHNDAKILHRNLCFENIFVDSNNTWKIAGFDFSCRKSCSSVDPFPDKASSNIIDFNIKMDSTQVFPSLKVSLSTLTSSIVPNWSCSAPEHSNLDEVTPSSDVYSLGIISCALLGNSIDEIDLSYEYGLMSDTYRRGLHFREICDKLPVNIKTSIMKYASINADSRPTLEDYQNLAIFNDQQVRAIRDLDSQLTWDRLKKIDFFNRLRDILPRLSHQVKVNRIANSLFNEVFNPEMLPHVLPNILIIAEDSTPSEFKAKIFPHLKAPFRVLEPRSIPLMLLDNLPMLSDRAKLCLPEFQQSAFTLIQYLLRTDQQLQEKSLYVLPRVKRFIDIGTMSSMLLPELGRLNSKTDVLAIRIKILNCIENLVDVMDRSTIVNQVLPIIFETSSREAGVIMAITSVIKTIANDSKFELTKDLAAGKLIPFLVPLTIERDLNLSQFNIIMSFVRILMDRVEREQRESLAKKSQAQVPKGGPLVLDNFKGSSHFQLD